MGYPKNTLVINPERDIPLLRQVRNSRFVGHQQLFEFLCYDAVASSRTSFNWRVRRLLKARLIARLESLTWQGSPVYSITHNGLVELESQGEFAIALHSGTRHMPHRAQVFHALELNAIRLSLARNQLLISWQSEVEISSTNMVSAVPYQKDYDAIVKMWVGNEMREFALEYERSLKSAKRYEGIRTALEAERQIGCVLYLTVSPVLLVAVLHQLTPISQCIGFATARSFQEQLLAASVTTEADRAMVTLEEFLQSSYSLYS
jgi:hypothetical protein